MGDFNYNAPQYIDFTSPTELELQGFGEEYFDMDHEIEVEYNEVSNENNEEEYSEARQSSNPDLSTFQNDSVIIIEDSDDSQMKLRRSVSAGHIIYAKSETPKKDTNQDEEIMENALVKALDNLSFKSAKKPSTKLRRANGLSVLPSKPLVMQSEQPKRLRKPQSISRDAIHKIGISSNDKLKRKMSAENLHSTQPNKYISLAEAIQRFQFGTPQRFHTQSNKTQFNSGGNAKMIALHHTIANSPALATKARSRATEYLGHDKQEQMEAVEMKKHQIKAHPVNYKILRAPVLPTKSEVTVTKPEPFKFTEVKYHSLPKEPPKEVVYEFHARPAPKTTAPGAIPVSRRSVMPKIDLTKKPPTPTFRRKYQADTLPAFCDNANNNKQNIKTVDMQHDGIQKTLVNQKPTKTQLKPFSFEERDRKIQEKKEEKIRKFLEEEKKAREFHARPIPVKVIGQCKKVESKVVKLISEGSSGSLKEHKVTDENIEPIHFKARPATVIHKKPFIPKKEERPLLEIQEFNLNTNHRAREREEFDKKLKEKEEEVEHHKKEHEEYRRKLEEEEVKRLRKEIVHKANPIKAYKPIEIMPSMKKVTSPKSPFKSHKRINDTH